MKTVEQIIYRLENDTDEFEPIIDAIEKLKELDKELNLYKNALWKACGDDEEVVNATLDSQRQ